MSQEEINTGEIGTEEERIEEIYQLHKERSAIQSAFTRTENKIIALIDENDCRPNCVEDSLVSMDKIFDNLQRKVDEILDLSPGDIEERSKLALYIKELENRHMNVKNKVLCWIEDTSKSKETVENEDSKLDQRVNSGTLEGTSKLKDTDKQEDYKTVLNGKHKSEDTFELKDSVKLKDSKTVLNKKHGNQEDTSKLEDSITPEDSVSQAGSKTSNISTRSKAEAKRASVQVKLSALKRRQELQQRKLEIEMEEENLKLETELAAAEAEISAMDNGSQLSSNTQERIRKRTNLSEKDREIKGVQTGVNLSGTIGTNSDTSSHDVLTMLQLPKVEILKFDGNPLRYWTFIRSFDSTVGVTNINNSAKLNRLLQYCTGKARDLIEGCIIMDPEHGYPKARRMLLERFGNKYLISKAWVDNITDVPNLKPNDSAGLRKYADSVRSCVVSLSAMGRLSEVDNQLKMKQIVEKLPLFMQNSWRKQAVTTLHQTGQYPDIEDLATFLETVARELSDPIFGIHMKDSSEKPRSGFKSSSNFVAKDTQESGGNRVEKFCRCCRQSHYLYQCQTLKDMDLQGRRNFVIKNKLCFNCFSSRHVAPLCNKDSFCENETCRRLNRKHSQLLHYDSRRNNPRIMDQSTSMQSCSRGVNGAGKRIALPIVPVSIKGNHGQAVEVYALLDPGSTNTFCSAELANELNLKGNSALLSLNTLTDDNRQTQTKVVSLCVSDVKGRNEVKMTNVFVLAKMPTLDGSVISQGDVNDWEHLQGLDLPFIQGAFAKVSLLIGQDNPHVLTPVDVRSGRADQPYATKTMFGWAINGPLHKGTQQHISVNFVQMDKNLETQVEKFWKMENIGGEELQLSYHDKQVVKLWDSTVEREDGHYKLPIPFKSDPPDLPNNYIAAEARLESLGRKLSRDRELSENYKAGINEMVQRGYAERVPNSKVDNNSGCVWYLPHHVVLNEKKPGKFRIVFDCSAKFAGTSLNDAVHQGPDLTNSLLGVLLRFRENAIAIAGDIESMFHRVKVADKHCDALRFLWWKNGQLGGDIEVFRMTSHLFGGIWSSSCANYALKRVAKDNAENCSEKAIETINNNFYVDDCLKSVKTEEEGITLVRNLCEILQKGAFRLTKIMSNSRQVLQSVPVKERAKDLKDVNLCEDALPQEKALGVSWNTEYDELGFKYVPKEKPSTKRGLISVISSVYDPLGFLSPLILRAKKIFQDECRLKKEWDSRIEPENSVQWGKWLSKLHLIEQFTVPRCVIPPDLDEVVSTELHHFADASSTGYGAVSYLRMKDSKGRIACSFLIGKSRLAPIKSITIPRLELCAAVLSIRLDQVLRKELCMDIGQSVFWTDSMIVLHYIKNNSQRYQVFVANRVTKIREVSSPQSWRHVGTASNPADAASRGLDADELLQKDMWLRGPSFLWTNEDEWPAQPSILAPPEDLEIKKAKVNFAVIDRDETCTDGLMNRYSSWFQLKKTVSWILRLKQCLLDRVRQKLSRKKISMEPVSASEMRQAESEIIKYVQISTFQSEIECLSTGRPLKKSSSICPLEPFLNHEGILCVGGRLGNAPIDEESKHQKILPKGHFVVTLIVRNSHEQLGHSGTEHVLAHVRTRFWVIKARSVIKKTLRNCVCCKRLQGKPLQQRMSDLPKDRVTPSDPPFSQVGVDCFGPFMIKRGRSEVKRYGCLFTCLTTRAIHIEKLDSMDTDSFINALKRFEARRGAPRLIRSDNGSNFRGAEKELREAINAWNQQAIHKYLLQKEVTWMFNPPAASHMGGVWERQIRTVRKVLNALLTQQQNLQDEGLSTLFCEVESIVNSRPITVNPDSHSDMEPLTPNHILLLRSAKSSPPGAFTLKDRYTRRWRHIQSLADQFWARWLREYLPTLQLRQKWLQSTVNLKVGDIVLMINENLPRYVWPLARVTQAFPSRDGLVRSVEIKTKDSLFTRPIHKLCLLESVCEENGL